MSFTKKFEELPTSIKNLLRYGIEITKPKKVVLFGSRARGDYSKKSDYDISFFKLGDSGKWSKFMVNYENEALTLLKVDLLVFEEASKAYCRNINKEGIVLYES